MSSDRLSWLISLFTAFVVSMMFVIVLSFMTGCAERRGQEEAAAIVLNAPAPEPLAVEMPDIEAEPLDTAAASADVTLEQIVIARSGPVHTQKELKNPQAEFGSRVGFLMTLPQGGISSPSYTEIENRERYQDLAINEVRRTATEPISTFSIDVDTGAYANMRRFLNSGQLPPTDAVRTEEFINYFIYDYAPPAAGDTPFAVHWEVAPTPWNAKTRLLKIGLKGYEPPAEDRPDANLVFLLDVSGSMNAPDKLPLMVSAMKLLTSALEAGDRVSVVVYAGRTATVIDGASGADKGAIKAALSQLQAGGSTAGGAGIELAYAMAEKHFIPGGINRVILATDGDFNVGISNTEMLKDIIARKREAGISLTTLGFGTGNYNEALMEQLADVGNGNYSYIDSLKEGQKVLVEQMAGTLMTIAKDVKIQVEFNPAVIAHYRLIGYENRLLRPEDFDNDKVDAGEIGAGHAVTALYEIDPVGAGGFDYPELRYEEASAVDNGVRTDELGFLKLRYKAPDGDESELMTTPLPASALEGGDGPTRDMRFAAAVSAFAEQLRGSRYVGAFGYRDIVALAEDAIGGDSYRGEFIELVKLAGELDERKVVGSAEQ